MRLVLFGFIFVPLALFTLVAWLGERFWLTGLLLYALPLMGLVPLLGLIVMAVLGKGRLLILGVLYSLIFMIFFSDFSWSAWEPRDEHAVTIVTNNVGQNKGLPIDDFILQEQPDCIALQEVGWYQATEYGRRYSEYAFAHRGEFVLLSRFPILDSGYLESRGILIGAWFEILIKDREVMVYNIHFPSPRRSLLKLKGSDFLGGLITGDGIFSTDVRSAFAQGLRRRVRWVQDLTALLDKEKRPFLVVGDFNMSAQGYLYRLFAQGLQDAFRARGRGWGYTFPGDGADRVPLIGPWLRLDYIFSSSEWTPLYCRTEDKRRAQHRAVSAAFAFPPP